MKILILTSYPIHTLEHLSSHFHTIAYAICKYLSINHPNIELVFDQCCQKGRAPTLAKSVDHHIYPSADHALLIENKGFYCRTNRFVHRLRKFVSGAICSIGLTSNHLGPEDILFHLNSNGLVGRKHTQLLDWKVDHSLVQPFKQDDTLNILLDINNDEQILTQINDFITTSNTVLQINVSHLQDIIHFPYSDLLDIINETDIFFTINKSVDESLLYFMGMANVVIVGPSTILSQRSYRLLDVVDLPHLYGSYVIYWDKIIMATNNVNTRSSLINNGFTWESGVDTIVNTLLAYDLSDSSSSLVSTRTLRKIDKINNKIDTLRQQLKSEKAYQAAHPNVLPSNRKILIFQSNLQSLGSKITPYKVI